VIRLRNEARKNRDFATSDRIRDELAALNIILKDSKEGTDWSILS
jgi:cysteinyl-tRNA synthetase